MTLCVLIHRGLDASHTGPYGSRWIDTPSLNALASQGVVFETHLAAHPDPETARRVWRTGRHHFPMREASSDAPPTADLIAVLRGAGVHTSLLIDTGRPSPASNEAGWDEVRHAHGLDATIDSGRDLLAALRDRASGLVWIELAALLPPWQVEETFIEPYFDETPDPAEDAEDEEALAEADPIEP